MRDMTLCINLKMYHLNKRNIPGIQPNTVRQIHRHIPIAEPSEFFVFEFGFVFCASFFLSLSRLATWSMMK